MSRKNKVLKEKSRKQLNISRTIAVAIMLAVLWGLFWVFFISGLADPVIEAATPAYTHVANLINDPLGIDWGGQLMAVALIMVPHLGILFFMFDDSMR